MRFCAIISILFAIAVCVGCRKDSLPPTPPISTETPSPSDSSPADPIDALAILDQMVGAYKKAISYSDRATVQIIGKMSQPDTEPVPWNCIVAFLKPNALRLEINDGIFISDGEDCYAQIQQLPDQVLHFPAPANWTLETLFQDVHLDSAMALGLPRSVLRFPPQLILLFANNPLNTFCPRGAKIEWIAREQIDEISCDVIQISHSDGNRILWISQENQALLRMDYQPVGLPVPGDFESIEAIRIEMTDAQFDWTFGAQTFQMLQPEDATQVTEFHSDTPELPTLEEHQRRLKVMSDNDTYRQIDQHIESASPTDPTSAPKTAPKTFSLLPVWSQPLMGVDTMAFLQDDPAKLLIPYEGNVVKVFDLKGKELQEKISPAGLEEAIIMHIQGHSFSGERRVGILTLDGKFYLFDESFKPIEDQKEEIRHFHFIRHREESLLLLALNGTVRAVDSRGTLRWESAFEGVPNQISSAVMDNQLRVFVSYSAPQDSILVLSPDGEVLEPVNILFGRRVLWFNVIDSTIYLLWETIDTGDIRFVGCDMTGNSQWSRLLPTGEYEVNPVFIPSKKWWFVPSPNGEMRVFDQIGNVIDKFSLETLPTGLLCLEVAGETLLIVADGEMVSAWTIQFAEP